MMKLRFSALAVAFTFAVAAPRLSAQAVAAATGNALAVGVAYENADPDYGPVRSQGLGIYANYDFSRYVGATVELNFQTAFSHNVVFLEHNYMFGVRGEYHKKRFLPYGKILIGDSTSSVNGNFPLLNAPGSYPTYAIGAGLDYRFQHHLSVRVIDFEQQEWLSYHPNGLTPTIISFGAAYRFQ